MADLAQQMIAILCVVVLLDALTPPLLLVLTFAIDLRATITESVWDPAVSVVRWFALGYGVYLINRLLPLYVAAGRTRREFLGSVALFLAGAGAVLAALLTLGFALEGVLYRAMDWPHRVATERRRTAERTMTSSVPFTRYTGASRRTPALEAAFAFAAAGLIAGPRASGP